MAVKHIKFFEKNKGDVSNTAVIMTASQGDDFADLVRNRSNYNAWVTSGSVDADNTTLEMDFVDTKLIDHVILVKHNFKNYTVKYWDGLAYQAFSTAATGTNNTEATTYHTFTAVETTKIQLTITGTMTANEDKYLYQMIASVLIGELAGWPVIKGPISSRSRITNKTLSGKQTISEQIGYFECKLDQKIMKNTADVAIVESLFFANEGFLVWLCGGDEDQFGQRIRSYRNEDIFLMKCENEYKPELYKGLYQGGFHSDIQLVEVND